MSSRSLTLIAFLSVAAFVLACGQQQAAVPPSGVNLASVASFDNLEKGDARAAALFVEAGKVIQHPRCVNCHPAGDRPLQGEDGAPHQPFVQRGADGHGVPGLQCSTCHHESNFDPGQVPGAPHWHLAPIEMAWEGLTLAEVCEQIKDPARNGGRDLEAIAKHMEQDPLVAWGWAPGEGREPVPGTQQQFADLIRAWVKNGAGCPS